MKPEKPKKLAYFTKILEDFFGWFFLLQPCSQGSFCIPHPTLIYWGGQPGFFLYIPADSGSLMIGVLSQGSYGILELTSSLGCINQGSYCIPQLTTICWGNQLGFLLYTQADYGSLGWSARKAKRPKKNFSTKI